MLSKRGQDEIRGRVESQTALDAFDKIVARMEALEPFQIKEGFGGSKRALTFSIGRGSYYSFIANSNWLLWYFRRPGFNAGVFTWEELENEFPGLARSSNTDPSKAEGTLRITNASEADAVMRFVESKISRVSAY